MKRLFAVLALTTAASSAVAGSALQPAGGLTDDPKATPAYAVLVQRKAAVEAELADLSTKFTRDTLNVRAKRFELNAVGREMERMQNVSRNSIPRLSNAYGNLVLSKVALEVELKRLLANFTPGHPDVKKKKAELASLEREIENILK